jgi:hypothetical protein
MEHYIVGLQTGLISNRMEEISQIPVCILPARLLPVETCSTVQDKVPFTPSLITQNHPAVPVIVPLFPITNLPTISGNRPLLSEINLRRLRLPRIKHPYHDPRNLSRDPKNLFHDSRRPRRITTRPSHDPGNLSRDPKNLFHDLRRPRPSHDPGNLSRDPKNLSHDLKPPSRIKRPSHDPRNLSRDPKNLSQAHDLKNLFHDPKQQGPIPSSSPFTPAPTRMLQNNRHHLPHFRSQIPTYIQRRVVHERGPPSRTMLWITRMTHRMRDNYPCQSSSTHLQPSWGLLLQP